MVESAERTARVGEIELAYETFGDPADPAVLMIMGLGAQMIFWPEELCERLAARGRFVIRFDNRDSGRSTILDDRPPPPLMALLADDVSDAPYGLAEMASDAVGLLDRLGIERPHVVGASMGGMIAQRVAIDHPARVLSLGSVMSMTGDRTVGRPTDAAVAVLASPLPADLEGYVLGFLAAVRVIGSPGFPLDEGRARVLAERSFERGIHPAGTLRQLAAILASPDRTPELRGVKAPTVVIHGTDDPLIDVSGGGATAAAIPGAELVLIEGMGHDLPEGAWERITGALERNFERVAGDS